MWSYKQTKRQHSKSNHRCGNNPGSLKAEFPCNPTDFPQGKIHRGLLCHFHNYWNILSSQQPATGNSTCPDRILQLLGLQQVLGSETRVEKGRSRIVIACRAHNRCCMASMRWSSNGIENDHHKRLCSLVPCPGNPRHALKDK
jgi:hypothetical protein